MNRPAKPDPCIQCGAPSSRLCDFCIGWPIAEYVRVGQPSENRFMALVGTNGAGEAPLPFTCDAPLCDRCTKEVGRIHMSGKSGMVDPIDRCPQHAGDIAGERIVPMTEEEAGVIRRDVWARYRRQKFSKVG